MSEQSTVMLVHGAWHGSWCWDAVRAALDAAGIPSLTVDNPSVTTPGSDLAADGDNLRRALDAIDGPVTLVGHSYGGGVITDAGTHPSVTRLVYLSAFAIDDGESVSVNGLAGGDMSDFGSAMLLDGECVVIDPKRATEFFFHDCSPEIAEAACARLRPQSLAALGGITRNVAWREKPATYIVCTDDRAVPVELQRASAARVDAVLEMPTSHSPFLSRPGDLARMLAELTVT